MAYTKTNWQARQGTGLNRFAKSQETGGSVVLTPNPEKVTVPGTPFTPENMNHIEAGIADLDTSTVKLTGAQTVAGVKTFSSRPVLPASDPTTDNEAARKAYVDKRIPATEKGTANGVATLGADGKVPAAQIPTGIAGLDTSTVKLTGAQTVAGVKTFSSRPVLPASDPTTDNEAARKAYVDKRIPATEKGTANGVATLGADGKVPVAQLPSSATNGLLEVTRDTSLSGSGTSSSPLGINFPPENNTLTNNQKYPLPYKYLPSAVFDLNTYRTPGEYTLYSPASSSTNFPDGWGTGTANSAFLKVMPFYMSGTTAHAVRQELHKRGTNRIWIRYSTSATAWGAWEEIATLASPVFTDSPKVGVNRIAVVPGTALSDDTNLPIGTYILVQGNVAYPNILLNTIKTSANVEITLRLPSHTLFYSTGDAGTYLSGSWRSSGAITYAVGSTAWYLFRRVL
ncbi:MAG: pyocin knob domain-containing protein [Spirochaetaceae bacterium]|jgi:hypothetical protein|nr:pyocin knob domain-containing protein [Spirochaetaceae bacterium]